MKSEENNSEAGDEVTVPEEFQKRAHELIKGASKHHLSHLRDRINAREDEMYKEEMKTKKANTMPSEYTTDGMPT